MENRPRPRRIRLLGGVIAAAIVTFGGHTAVSNANEMTVFSCHDPAGNAVGNGGWSMGRTSDGDIVISYTCAKEDGGSLGLELQANGGGYPNAARAEWIFNAPSWGSITSYRLALTDSYGRPGGGGGDGQAFVEASDESDPNYDYRNLGAGALGASVINRTPPSPDRSITLNASCDGLTGPCAAGVRTSRIDLQAGTVTLQDPTVPTVSDVTGSLLPGASIRGESEVDFTAADSGPGIYSGRLTVDGQEQPAEILNANGGACESLGQTTDGTRSFAGPEPCAKTTGGALTLNTVALSDGTHTVKLTVDDASGNSVTAFNATITTHNAPANTATPTITGDAGIGGALTAHPGEWAAPVGAGTLIYGYQWQECDGQGNSCSAIPGANGAAYAPRAADVGHALRAAVTASDEDGATVMATAPTAPIPQSVSGALLASLGAPNGGGASQGAELRLDGSKVIDRAFARRAVTLEGRLVNAAGAPIAGAQLDVLVQPAGSTTASVVAAVRSGPSGHVAVLVAGGPSRAITLAYRAFFGEPGYAAQTTVKETVQAGVLMHITPRQTTPAGSIAITGTVSGPIPRRGVVVTLLVHYRGQWEPFRDPHTDANGRFHVRYHFQGAIGRFPFRAEVLGEQAGLPYATGQSASVNVRTG